MKFLAAWLNPSLRFQTKYAEHLRKRFQLCVAPNTYVPLEQRMVEPRGLTAALANQARVVITGGAGAGKTTTLAYLALWLAREMRQPSPARVPLYFSARDWDPAALPRLTDVPRALHVASELAAQCPPTFFPTAVQAGRAVVLIDDADQLPTAQLQAWLSEWQAARIILSARTPLAGFTEFRLPGFRDNDLELFAKQWNAEKASAFLVALKTDRVPRTLTANPMTLTLLTQVWREGQPLPTHRTALFDAIVANTLQNSPETATMLEGVALAIQRGKPASNEFVARSKGFLRLGKHRTAEFIHDLWQAYFAARALRRAPTLDPLREHVTDPAWREVVLFYAGLGDASALAEHLVAQNAVVLAGWVIAHAREVRPALRETITQALIARAWEGAPDAIAALAEMQSDAAVDAFAAKFKDKDPTVRMRAAHLLGQLQLDRGIEYLLPQLRDVSADVRECVVEALGHSRTNRVIEPLLVALRGDPRGGVTDTRLRVAAAKALGEIASDKAVPALIVDLQVGEPDVRAVAADALKRIASPLVRKPLEGILHTGDEQARQYAAEVLAVLNGKD